MNMKKVIFLFLKAFIVIALFLGFGWQVMDQMVKFVDKKTTIASRFVETN